MTSERTRTPYGVRADHDDHHRRRRRLLQCGERRRNCRVERSFITRTTSNQPLSQLTVVLLLVLWYETALICCFAEDCFRPQIQRGNRGAHVAHAQNQLLKVGDPTTAGTPAYHVHTTGGADGIFGRGTEQAVVAYQKLIFPEDPSEWDGIVGSKTWARLGCEVDDLTVTKAAPPSPPSPPRPPSPPSPSPPTSSSPRTVVSGPANYCTSVVYNAKDGKAILHLPHDSPSKKRSAKLIWTNQSGRTKKTKAGRKTIVTIKKPSTSPSVEFQVRYKRPKETWQCITVSSSDDTRYRCYWQKIEPETDMVVPQECHDVSLVNCGVGGGGGEQQRASTCNDCPPSTAKRRNYDCVSYDCSWMTITNFCREALSDNVRTASVHLWHQFPVGNVAWWFQQLTIEAASDATYFATSGHSYGYGGFQVVEENPLLGRLIFSIWDQGGCDRDMGPCNPENVARTVACGTGVVCQDFGAEGTGRKSTMDSQVMPVVGVTYSFMTQAVPIAGTNRVEYTGYAYSDFSGWQLLSRIQVSRGTKDWAIHSPYSFVEQWVPVTALEDRKGLFGPSLVSDSGDGESFVQVPSSTFDHGTLENHERVNAWLDESKAAVGIATGGRTVQKLFRGTTLFYPQVSTTPAALSDFVKKIPCLSDAFDAASIEACLAAL